MNIRSKWYSILSEEEKGRVARPGRTGSEYIGVYAILTDEVKVGYHHVGSLLPRDIAQYLSILNALASLGLRRAILVRVYLVL